MLTDIVNHVTSTPLPSSPAPAEGLKRPATDDLAPSKPKAKRGLGECSLVGAIGASELTVDTPIEPSSSSSPSAARSSSPFANNQLAAFDAPTSPSSSKLPTSPDIKYSSLPPSSPSFARGFALLEQAAAQEHEPEADEPLTLRLERGTVMQFGRKAKRRAIPTTETTLPIMLPKSAKNASRLHCTARIVSSAVNLVVEIRVLGMNGMKIDGKLWKAGSVAVLPVEAGAKLDLFFWGFSSTIIVAESEVINEATTAHRSSKISPPASVYHDDDGDLSLPEEPNSVAPSSVAPSIAAPISPAHSDLSALSSSPARDAASAPSTRAESLLASLGLDISGLVASQIVFSPRSTVGVEEVVKGLLKEVGGMWNVLEDGKGSEEQSEEREDRAVEEWWDVVEQVLREQPFFGCIDNAGLKVRDFCDSSCSH